jgi:hypothetical protein
MAQWMAEVAADARTRPSFLATSIIDNMALIAQERVKRFGKENYEKNNV